MHAPLGRLQLGMFASHIVNALLRLLDVLSLTLSSYDVEIALKSIVGEYTFGGGPEFVCTATDKPQKRQMHGLGKLVGVTNLHVELLAGVIHHDNLFRAAHMKSAMAHVKVCYNARLALCVAMMPFAQEVRQAIQRESVHGLASGSAMAHRPLAL